MERNVTKKELIELVNDSKARFLTSLDLGVVDKKFPYVPVPPVSYWSFDVYSEVMTTWMRMQHLGLLENEPSLHLRLEEDAVWKEPVADDLYFYFTDGIGSHRMYFDIRDLRENVAHNTSVLVTEPLRFEFQHITEPPKDYLNNPTRRGSITPKDFYDIGRSIYGHEDAPSQQGIIFRKRYMIGKYSFYDTMDLQPSFFGASDSYSLIFPKEMPKELFEEITQLVNYIGGKTIPFASRTESIKALSNFHVRESF